MKNSKIYLDNYRENKLMKKIRNINNIIPLNNNYNRKNKFIS